LVVEDNAYVRRLAVTLFRSLRLKVLEAGDGVEALEVFGRHADEIQLVFCDVAMPRLDGWATLKALRRVNPDVHVVLTSGHSEAEVMDRNRVDHPDDFVPKPYTRGEIRRLVARLWPSSS
jgi:CheY-like chemotaxis protein